MLMTLKVLQEKNAASGTIMQSVSFFSSKFFENQLKTLNLRFEPIGITLEPSPLYAGSIAVSKKIMAIQEAFASSPRLPGENGGGGVGAANNGHASLLSGSVSETGAVAPPPPLPPAVCSSCSASCSSTSSPAAAAAGVQPGILGCSARKEFRRSLVNCGEMGKSLIDIGELSAKTVDTGTTAAGVKAIPAVTAAGASPTGISATAAALLSFCPAGIYPPARECAACKEDAAAAARESQTGSSAATTPEQSAAAAAGSSSQEISPGQTGSEATDSGCPPAVPVGNGSVGAVRARAVTRTTVPTPLRVERKDNATPPSRPAAGGRQAVPRHRFIINLDDKNKFTDEVTV